MERLIKRKDINTPDYWNGLYTNGERRGWWHNFIPLGSIETFFRAEILKQLDKNKNSKFIEIGGGNGAGAEIIRGEFPSLEVWNLDISSTAIEQGSKKYPLIHQVCFNLNSNIDSLSLNNSFDIILCQETIEHIENLQSALDQIMKLLKINGVCCFSFPNNEGYTGGFEHIWTFDHNSIPKLFYKYTNEIIICNFQPFGKNTHLHLLVKFYKTK